jgi:hypothetical protein
MTDAQKFLDKIKTGVRYVVINTCYGGFGLSGRAETEYRRMAGITNTDWHDCDVERDDPYLVKIVQELGQAANGTYSNLKVVEIPGDVDWEIAEYDGDEWVAEVHRTWR